MKKSNVAILFAGIGLVTGCVLGVLLKDVLKNAAKTIYDSVTDFHDTIQIEVDDDVDGE